jgi:hypothetical protein
MDLTGASRVPGAIDAVAIAIHESHIRRIVQKRSGHCVALVFDAVQTVGDSMLASAQAARGLSQVGHFVDFTVAVVILAVASLLETLIVGPAHENIPCLRTYERPILALVRVRAVAGGPLVRPLLIDVAVTVII